MIYSNKDNNNIPFQEKLNKIFSYKKKGFYIELGANDGLIQSNSAFFEKEMEWTGILIEPSIKGYELCLKNRSKSICLNYACVSNDYNNKYIYGDFEDNSPMASIDGTRLKNKKLVRVEAITLEKILDKYCNTNIDFLSLDTEGYELNILKGMNLNKYRPNYMLIEIYNKDYDDIIKYLEINNYILHSNFSNYNKIDNVGWDGTHNDYLFIDNTLIK
jgi:FkbM family methyltransferase